MVQIQEQTQPKEAVQVSAPVSGAPDKTIGFETGRLAGQAGGAVLASIGDTKVLVTATASNNPREGVDFFPLTVDMEERMYAAGKIPGSFFRREGRSSDAATLACRLADRPLRPCFPKGFRNEVHIVGLVMSADQENPYDVMAINAASAALSISGIPFSGPIGAVRMAYTVDGQWIPHPTFSEIEAASFEMVVAGRLLDDADAGDDGAADDSDGGDVAIMMVEASGTEEAGRMYVDGAQQVDEAVLAEGLDASKTWIKEAVSLQRKLIVSAGVKPPMEYNTFADYSPQVAEAVSAAVKEELVRTEQMRDKAERSAATQQLLEQVLATPAITALAEAEAAGDTDAIGPSTKPLKVQVKAAMSALAKEAVRERIVAEGRRIDGRGTEEIRPLSAEAGVLPIAHGSGLFERGETQVMNITTLGNEKMDQIIDTIDPVAKKRYMHHYNFPPFSTGETGFMRGPKRREIGHGALAERALLPVVPSLEEFPYTLRLVSEVLSSNGSTSMASVCASSLSLMDAGVPIIKPVAGIAMGLIYDGSNYVTLTDILGAEDAYGDMDFKVAGTRDYVTALQLDTKIDGIPAAVLTAALGQARDARLAILDVMEAEIAAPRTDVKGNAPKIETFVVPNDKVGEIIGPKGKMINQLQDETGTEIDVNDSSGVARVTITSPDRAKVAEAKERIDLIVNPPTPEMGRIYKGTVVNITGFGAFVNFLPGRDGLLHISKLGGQRRLDKVEEVLSLNDEVYVMVEDDKADRISLRLATQEELADKLDGDGDSGSGADSGSDSHGDGAGSGSGASDSDADSDSDMDDDSAGSNSNDSNSNDQDGSEDSRREVSFGQEYDRQVEEDYGDLGTSDSGRRRRR